MMIDRKEHRRRALIALIQAYVPSRFKTQHAMAVALGFSPAHFTQMKIGNRSVGNEAADRLETGLELGMGGLDAMTIDAPIEHMVETNHYAMETRQEIIIPHINGRAKGGSGGLAPMHEYIVGSISVTASWLHKRLPSITAKSNLAVIEAYGRSMEPTLSSGDLMIVDTGVREAKVNGVYILLRKNTVEPELMVKRLQLTLDGGMIVRSDNRAEYDPETVAAHEVAEKVQILGRVVWIWAGRDA